MNWDWTQFFEGIAGSFTGGLVFLILFVITTRS